MRRSVGSAGGDVETVLVIDLGPQPPGVAGPLLDLMVAVAGSDERAASVYSRPEIRRAVIVGGYRARAVLISAGVDETVDVFRDFVEREPEEPDEP
jgi:hypothetical protein